MKLHERIFLELQNIRMIHWNAVGSNFDSLHSHTDEIIEQLSEDYDDIVELSIASGERITNPLIIKGLESTSILDKQSMSCSEGYRYLSICLGNVLQTVNSLQRRENLHLGLKTKLDNMSEWLSKEVEFKLKRVNTSI